MSKPLITLITVVLLLQRVTETWLLFLTMFSNYLCRIHVIQEKLYLSGCKIKTWTKCVWCNQPQKQREWSDVLQHKQEFQKGLMLSNIWETLRHQEPLVSLPSHQSIIISYQSVEIDRLFCSSHSCWVKLN